MHAAHLPLKFHCGSCVPLFGTVISRMLGNFAAAFSRSASLVLLMLHCMFDWPAQTQTSPMSTSLNVIVFLPLTVSVCGPPYSCTGSRKMCHMPSAAAVVEWVWLPSVTATASPGSALPQTLFLMPCCSTMWSPNMLLSDTSARAGAAMAVRRQAMRPTACTVAAGRAMRIEGSYGLRFVVTKEKGKADEKRAGVYPGPTAW